MIKSENYLGVFWTTLIFLNWLMVRSCTNLSAYDWYYEETVPFSLGLCLKIHGNVMFFFVTQTFQGTFLSYFSTDAFNYAHNLIEIFIAKERYTCSTQVEKKSAATVTCSVRLYFNLAVTIISMSDNTNILDCRAIPGSQYSVSA
jgi:hypothetical protein